MRVQILIPRTWQDAGVQTPLNVGQAYELPDVVAQSLIATGAAVSVDGAPERKPLRPRERK